MIALCPQPLSGRAQAEHANKRIDHRQVLDRQDIGRRKNLGNPRRTNQDPGELEASQTIAVLCYTALRCAVYGGTVLPITYIFLLMVSVMYCTVTDFTVVPEL